LSIYATVGKFGKTWPGLNTPVQVVPQKSKKTYKHKENYLLKPQMSEVAVTRPRKGQALSSQFSVERQQSKETPAWKKAFKKGEKMYGQDLSRRGWSGRTWRGREFGAPETATRGTVKVTLMLNVFIYQRGMILVEELAQRMDSLSDNLSVHKLGEQTNQD
jgi:hypothetical protein